jgi:glycosyltransferase involved in cell wall biosynthesis
MIFTDTARGSGMARVGYWIADINLTWGGVAPYSWRLLEALLARLHETSIELLVLCDESNETRCRELLSGCRGKATVEQIQTSRQWRAPLASRIWNRFGPMLPERWRVHGGSHPWYRWLESLKLDLLHIPHQGGPPLPLPCPFFFTPHDVHELHYPQFFSPRERASRALNMCERSEQCRGAIVSFAFVRDDLQRYFAIPADKIHVCPFPFQQVRLQVPSSEQSAEYQRKYAGREPFLLYPAQTWPHKNHLTLIRALGLLRDQSARIVHLVCTGRKTPEFFPTIERAVVSAGLADRVQFTDLVPETELHWLYRHCALAVVPTLYEAGCFPLVEAMFLQTPVICSAVTHLPETIQDSRFVFDPLDAESLASLIRRGIEDDDFRSANLANSRKRTEELLQHDPVPCLLRAWNPVLGKS